MLARPSECLWQRTPLSIQFSIQHYHAPAQFCNILQSLYSGLLGTIISRSLSTPTIPLEVGVYQGDPPSAVIFNTAINSLVDTLQTWPDFRFSVSNSHQVNLLQYADDTCITTSSPDACQHTVAVVRNVSKGPKCHCLVLQSSTGKLLNPHLSIQNQTIPFIGSGSIKFLGMTIQVSVRNEDHSKDQPWVHAESSWCCSSDKTQETVAVQGWYKSTADMVVDCPRTIHHLGGAAVRSNSYKICEEVGSSSKISQYSSLITDAENEWPEFTCLPFTSSSMSQDSASYQHQLMPVYYTWQRSTYRMRTDYPGRASSQWW